MKPSRVVLAVVAGLALGALPFLRYVHPPGEPHTDHAPRHGGELRMVGDHHVELARRRGRVEVFVSDAQRRPLRPQRGWVAFGDEPRVPLAWEGQRSWAPDPRRARPLTVELELDDGTRLSSTFTSASAAGRLSARPRPPSE